MFSSIDCCNTSYFKGSIVKMTIYGNIVWCYVPLIIIDIITTIITIMYYFSIYCTYLCVNGAKLTSDQ